jgi:hypothetical protein
MSTPSTVTSRNTLRHIRRKEKINVTNVDEHKLAVQSLFPQVPYGVGVRLAPL